MKIQFHRETVVKIYVAKSGENLLGWRHQGDMGITPNSSEHVLLSNSEVVSVIWLEFHMVFEDELGLFKNF